MWYSQVVPLLPVKQFKSFFRLTPMQFDAFKIQFEQSCTAMTNFDIPLAKQLHIFLYYVGNNPYTAEITDRFAYSTPLNVVYEIADLINLYLYPLNVKWPCTLEKTSIKQQFESFTGYQNVVGAVDGTHVIITGIGKFRAAYTTRKCVYAINVTLCCDFN